MYQSIDDSQDDIAPQENASWRGKAMGRIVLAIALIIIAAATLYWLASRAESPAAQPSALAAQKASYRTAISESTAPMRRARLQDFIATYPHSRHVKPAQAQLEIINSHEAARWREVTNSIYDTRLSFSEKTAALDEFEQAWGAALLGGRAKEIAQIRESISAAKDTPKTPDRSLEEGPSPIPETIADTELAGGFTLPAPPPPAVKIPTPAPEPVITLEVIAPKVRRNVEARYPRKAARRKIGAVVNLKLNIDEKGKVAMAELVSVQAERYEKDFVKAAERAALRTRYHPKTIGGKAVAASGVNKTYRFTME